MYVGFCVRACLVLRQVNGTAACVLTLIGMLFEGATPFGAGREGAFGFFNKGRCDALTLISLAPLLLSRSLARTRLVSSHHRTRMSLFRYALVSLYLALVPGIVGHTSFNAVLKYISPMVVTLAVTAEPLIGSLVGWGAGVSRPPGARTFLGGAILIASTMFVVRAEEQRKAGAPPLAVVVGADGGVADGGIVGGAEAAAEGVACAAAAEVEMRSGGAGDARPADGAG